MTFKIGDRVLIELDKDGHGFRMGTGTITEVLLPRGYAAELDIEPGRSFNWGKRELSPMAIRK